MEQEQTFILKDCKRTFYKLDKDGKPFCRVGMYIYLEGLTLWRYDFQSWDYNEKNGIVRMDYSVSLVGVRQMCRLLGVYDSLSLIKRLKKECGFRVGYQKFIENFMAFCDKNSIQYNFNVWYWIKKKTRVIPFLGRILWSSFPPRLYIVRSVDGWIYQGCSI